MSSLPTIAVVLPNHNGKHHLDPCLRSLASADYPKNLRTIVVVDNGSVDGSADHLKKHHPEVVVKRNRGNLGFSAACNGGAELAADAKILVFLNNDMRVEPAFLRELVEPIVEGRADCTGGKILSWDGTQIDYAGGGMAFHGIGFQRGYQENPAPSFDREIPTLFACGGAMAIDRALFESAGRFDEDFFAYYEDADLGWRLWVLGKQVLYVPKAVSFHHHSATARTFPPESLRMLQVRNPLLTIFKNYGDDFVERALGAALLLAATRAVEIGGIDTAAFRIAPTASRKIGGMREVIVKAQRRLGRKLAVSKMTLADLVAIADVARLLPRFAEKRREIQGRRRRSDADIAPLFLNPHWCVEPRKGFADLQCAIEEFFRIGELFH